MPNYPVFRTLPYEHGRRGEGRAAGRGAVRQGANLPEREVHGGGREDILQERRDPPVAPALAHQLRLLPPHEAERLEGQAEDGLLQVADPPRGGLLDEDAELVGGPPLVEHLPAVTTGHRSAALLPAGRESAAAARAGPRRTPRCQPDTHHASVIEGNRRVIPRRIWRR
jgi:hypothetical protein